MAFVASHFRCPVIEVTIATSLNADFPPAQFQAGTLLLARNVGMQGTLYQRVITPLPSTPAWQAISGGSASLLTAATAPMPFAGGFTSDEVGTAVSGWLGNVPFGQSNPASDIPLQYPKNVFGLTGIQLLGFRGRIVIDQTTANEAATSWKVYQNGTTVIPAVTTGPNAGTVDFTATASPAVAVGQNDVFGIRVENADPGGNLVVLATIMLRFGVA